MGDLEQSYEVQTVFFAVDQGEQQLFKFIQIKRE